MTPETLIAKLRKAGYKPRSYSGRGMYGRSCVAVIDGPAPADLPPGAAKDSLGLDSIYYWPSVAWPESMVR